MKKTERGFSYKDFNDCNDEKCSIQKSSLATEDCIWLGIDDPKLTVFEENMGKYVNTPMPKTFMVSSRMHLTVDNVKELLPILNKFVKTGDI